MEDQKLQTATNGAESEWNSDVGDVIRDADDGEGKTLSLDDKSACVGGDSEEFDNPVMAAAENTIGMEQVELLVVSEETEQRVMLEDIERPATGEVIEQPILSESPVIASLELADGENTDPQALEPKLDNNVEELRNEISDAEEENVVSDEIPGSTDSTLLAKEASGPSLDENAQEQELLDSEARQTVDELDCKSERNMGDAENFGDVGGVLVENSTLTEDAEAMAVVTNVCDENVDHSLNLEVGPFQNATSLYERMLDHEVSENIGVSNVNAESAVGTEESTSVVSGNERVQVHNFSGDMKHAATETLSVTAGDEVTTKDESLDSRTSSLANKKNSVDVYKGSDLDKTVNDEEAKEEEEGEELLPMGNTKTETHSGMELATMGCDMLERFPLENSAVETDVAAEVFPKGILNEDDKMQTEETSSNVDEPGQSIPDSPVGLPEEEDETMTGDEDIGTQDTEMETEAEVESGKTSGMKRKRGKVSKSTQIPRATGKGSSRKKVREDVCFICFEGGELVVCGRRGCPKAYHPSCVNRDEAFFRSKGRWNCGWHLCSICEKNAYYMCYTCAYSLCKSCIKDADAIIFCVRGTKGFCETCMRTVNLIESDQQESDDAEVDFDDRSSWECLFKDYYTELKAKLSLSSSEIDEAKNHFKGAEISTGNTEDIKHEDSGSEDSTINVEPAKPKTKKVGKSTKGLTKDEAVHRRAVTSGNRVTSLYGNADWASKELLEFISHMKDGDISMLSQFDVQALLLEYIKRNKLRDPHRGSQILCDARLKSLFGKPRVGHFEMLKLIESHFLLKDEQNDDVQSSVVDTENLQLDTDGNTDTMQKGVKDKKRRSRKKGDAPQSNHDDHAAIDMHNIGLIYLRRKLMEDLLEDAETFPDKVTGTFVRIRILGSNQKQDLYRLVQVVGTSKSPEPYKIGKKTADLMVDILNLDKIETISIDTISNQDFTEEECKRLRQSIKCGLINPLTVGVILGKAMELQVIRVNDLLESEILRISHLCDRASDLGRRKEHRECVEKLQLLKTPEERRRRLDEFPEIHTDPKMDPSYESEDNDSETENSKQDAYGRSIFSDMSKRERGFISPRGDNSTKEPYNVGSQASIRNVESGRNVSRNIFANSIVNAEMVYENTSSLRRDKETRQSDNLERVHSATASESSELTPRPRSGPVSVGKSITSGASTSTQPVEKSVKINESEKIWHYLDPSGKVQGPFSMVQLRKWNNTGYFPANLSIWRATEKQENSVFLTDALAGKFPRELPSSDQSFSSTRPMLPSHNLLDHSVRSSDTSVKRDEESPKVDSVGLSSLPNLSKDTFSRNGTDTLVFPPQGQSNFSISAEHGSPLAGAIMSTAASGLQPSVVSPNPASVPSVAQTAAFTPPPSSQHVMPSNSAASLPTQSTSVSEPLAVQMVAQPVHNQNPNTDTQAWGSGTAPPVQPQGYNWGTPTVQNSSGGFQNLGPSGIQPDSWRPIQGSQQTVPPGSTQNASWNMGPPQDNSASMGPSQTTTNMGWMNPAPANTNVNWAQGGNQSTGWVAPPGPNAGPNMQGFVPGNANPAWGAPPTQQSWANPSQGQVPGNAWGPPPGNPNGPPPPPVQGPPPPNQGWGPPSGVQGSWTGDRSQSQPPPGNAPNQGWGPPRGPGSWTGDRNQGPPVPPPGNPPNQGWGPPSGGQGSWTGDQNNNRGGRPWNRQSSFGGGGGGSRFKRDMVCPYNANGRCKKGARCDYMHV